MPFCSGHRLFRYVRSDCSAAQVIRRLPIRERQGLGTEPSPTTSSPNSTVPPSTRQAKLRKSWCGRTAFCAGKQKSRRLAVAGDRDVLQVPQERGNVIPVHVGVGVHHIIPNEVGDELDVAEVDLLGEMTVFHQDLVIARVGFLRQVLR